jgi:hypothetical protein
MGEAASVLRSGGIGGNGHHSRGGWVIRSLRSPAISQALAAWWGHHTFRDGANRGTAVWFRLDWNPA